MKIKGHFLFGSEGMERFLILNDQNKKMYLERAKEENSSLYSYSPWMCSSYLIKNYSKEQANTFNALTPTAMQIRYLNSIVYKDQNNPFGLIDAKLKYFRLDLIEEKKLLNFSNKISRSTDLLKSLGGHWSSRTLNLVNIIIPIKAATGGRPLRKMGSGFSTHWFKGGIFLSLPEEFENDHLELALNIAHEIGHQSLMILQDADPIIQGDLNYPIYSVIRQKNRPAILSFHALTAVAFMLEFVLNMKEKIQNSSEKLYLDIKLIELVSLIQSGIETFENIKLTSLGSKILEEFKELSRLAKCYPA